MKRLPLILLLLISTIAFPQKSKTKFKEVITSEGDTLRIGQSIQLGMPTGTSAFRYISQGSLPVSRSLTKMKVQIHKLQMVHSENAESELIVSFKGYGMLPLRIEWEAAREHGEVDRPK